VNGYDERLESLEIRLDESDEDSTFEEVFGAVDIHGYISQGYMRSNKNNFLTESSGGSFQFNELGINFSVELSDQLHAGLQLASRDLGSLGNSKILVDWAFMDYHYQDWMGLRVGRVKMPFGLYNETRDVDMLRTSILLPQGVYNENFRDSLTGVQGLGLYGTIPLASAGDLDYQALVGTTNIDTDSGAARAFQDSFGMVVSDLHVNTSSIYSLRWDTPVEGLLLAGTYLDSNLRARGVVPGIGLTESDTNPTSMRVLSAEYTWNDLILAAEWLRMITDSSVRELTGGTTIVTDRRESEGYYLSAAYRFSELFELGSYYSIYYHRIDDRDGNGLVALGKPAHGAWLKDIAVTTRFDLTENWVFKLEGHLMDGTAGLSPSLNPAGTSQDWILGLAKITVSF